MRSNLYLKPQDIVILLKLLDSRARKKKNWQVAQELGVSPAEYANALSRVKFNRMIWLSTRMPNRKALKELLFFGVPYIFGAAPGHLTRGIPTAHSAEPLASKILSDEFYVWPSEEGKVRGAAIQPLYKSVPEAIARDEKLYELLSLVDAIRVGRSREILLARVHLEKRIDEAA